jgi:hypothetical protein
MRFAASNLQATDTVLTDSRFAGYVSPPLGTTIKVILFFLGILYSGETACYRTTALD